MTRKALLLILILVSTISCSSVKADSQPVKGKFAFFSLREGDSVKYWAVYTLIDGKIKKVSNGIGDPVWSPDGKKLACGTAQGNLIRFYDASGNFLKEIKLRYRPFAFDWFPDGTRMLYVGVERISETNRDAYYICTLNLEDGSEKKIITLKEGEEVYRVCISPKGNLFAYSTGTALGDPRVEEYLYVSDINGENPRRVLPKVMPILGWFPDGVRLAIQTNTTPDGKRINLANGVIAEVNVETAEFKILKETRVLSGDTRLSKDGKYIYYPRSTPDRGEGIFALSLDSDKEIQITKPFFVNSVVKASHDIQPNWYQGE